MWVVCYTQTLVHANNIYGCYNLYIHNVKFVQNDGTFLPNSDVLSQKTVIVVFTFYFYEVL